MFSIGRKIYSYPDILTYDPNCGDSICEINIKTKTTRYVADCDRYNIYCNPHFDYFVMVADDYCQIFNGKFVQIYNRYDPFHEQKCTKEEIKYESKRFFVFHAYKIYIMDVRTENIVASKSTRFYDVEMSPCGDKILLYDYIDSTSFFSSIMSTEKFLKSFVNNHYVLEKCAVERYGWKWLTNNSL